ncbi:uncharacterized protein LOC116170926 isoform X2 [Photinus pyralis]|nr:uncharacterized protein LOC116170926 isoform X2 [Photinus pyralis]
MLWVNPYFDSIECLLIICAVKCVPPVSSKSERDQFFKVLNGYYEKPKSVSEFDNYYSSAERTLRNMGENNVVCEVSSTTQEFYEEGYEFHPRTYVNETCMSTNIDPYVNHSNRQHLHRVICLHNDNKFGCQTLYEEINVWKKSTTEKKECLEHTSQLVAVGCKCNIRFSNNRG